MSLNITAIDEVIYVITYEDDTVIVTTENNSPCNCDWTVYLVDTSSSTLVFNMRNLRSIAFEESTQITTAKTWTIINESQTRKVHFFRFSLSGSHIQTMPSNFKMQLWDGQWDNTNKQWTPPQAGSYEAELTFNGVNWFLKIYGNF